MYREGKKSWTLRHREWLRRQRLEEPLAQAALEQMLLHLEALDARLAALDRQLERVAASARWCDPVRWLCCFRGISTLTALGLLAEIGDFRRFGSARELMSFLGLTVSEYSSGERRQRGSTTETGNRHARRLLVEAAWHYQHPPRLSARLRAQDGLVPPPGAGPRLAGADPPARTAPPARPQRQAGDRRHRRRRPRALRLPLGGDDPSTIARAASRALAAGGADRRLSQPLGDATLALGGRREPVRTLETNTCDPGPQHSANARPSCEAAHDRTPSCGPDPRIKE